MHGFGPRGRTGPCQDLGDVVLRRVGRNAEQLANATVSTIPGESNGDVARTMTGS
jgi:hypothetical protein